MIPGHHRTAADRPRQPIARRFAPEELHGNSLAFAILLSLLLWALLIAAGFHIIARIFA